MKTRIITAGILLAIVIPLIFIGGLAFAIAVGVVALLAYKEIVSLKLKDEKPIPNLIKIIGLIAFFLIVYSNYDGFNLYLGFNYKVIGAVLLLMLVPIIFINDNEKYSPTRALYLTSFIFIIGLGLNLLITVLDFSLGRFIYLLLIPILTDTFALFTGMMIGKHKLSKISPKKTWEGCIGGAIVGSFGAIIYYINFVGGNVTLLNLSLITLCLSIIGQLGDLFFSAIKRYYGIKDFSNLMPGHGGILDRLDSVIFVMIGYLLFFTMI